MKRAAFILGISLSLLTSPGSALAHGGCYGFWPFWPFAFGAGLALGSAAYYNSYYYPHYIYAPPVYTYSYPQTGYVYNAPASQAPLASQTQPPVQPQASAPAAPEPAQTLTWEPSSPGAGHWVPDPAPYSFNPSLAKPAGSSVIVPASQTVAVTRSVSGVPVYTVNR